MNFELERLKVVRQCNILDSGRDVQYDRICALTSRMLDVPFCFMGVLDQVRVWVKSTAGFTIAGEFVRADSLLNDASCLRPGEVFHVVDSPATTACLPFSNTSPQWLFYAHTPVVVAGLVVGALCIADTKSHPGLSATSKMDMLDLAHSFANILEQRREDFIFKSVDCMSLMESVGSTLRTSVLQIQATSAVLKSEIHVADGSCGVIESTASSTSGKELALREDCFRDIDLSIAQIGLMTNSARNISTDNICGNDNYSSLLQLVVGARDLLPMLVSEQRATWDLAQGLQEVQVRFADVLSSALMTLLLPLARTSTSLHTTVDFCVEKDEHKKNVPTPLIEPVKHLVQDKRVRLGRARVCITAREDVTDNASLQQALNNCMSLSDLEQAVRESLASITLCVTGEEEASKLLNKHVTTSSSMMGDDKPTNTIQVEYCISLPCKIETPLGGTVKHSPSESPAEDEVKGVEEEAQPLRVLVVDDSRMIQKVMGRFLKTKKCLVTTAENGLVGFEKLRHSCSEGESPFDVMFMDFLMPVMDGLEALRTIHAWRAENLKEAAHLEHLVTIGFSATAHCQEQDDAFDVGMDLFLPKPVNTKVLSFLFELMLQGLSTADICQQLHADFEECRITKPGPNEPSADR